MTLTDALAAALNDAIDDCPEVGWDESRTSDRRPDDVKEAIRAVLAGPTFRETLTAALVGALDGLSWGEFRHEDGRIKTPDGIEVVESSIDPQAAAAAIVARLLPVEEALR